MARRGLLSQVPPVTLRLIIATAVATIGCLLLSHAGYPQVLDAFALTPFQVVPGLRLWKLLSYVFVSVDHPLNFIFDLMMIYFFAGWFEQMQGSRRLVRFFAFSAIGAGVLPVLLGLFFPSVAGAFYTGAWPVFEALTVAMGILQPGAQINLYMLIPVTARQLMYGSWVLIALFVVFDGTVVPFLPAIGGVGMGFALTVGVHGPRRLWLRFQSARLERQLRRRAQHLRVVPKDGDKDSSEKKTYLN